MADKRSALFAFAVVLTLASPRAALAQSQTGRYFSAGVVFERRDLGNPEVETVTVGLNTVTKPIKRIRPGPSAAVGVFLTKIVGVEAQFQRSASDSWPYTYNYSGRHYQSIAEHHDTLLLANVRLRAKCWSRGCFEPVGGAGFAIHHSSSTRTATCGSAIGSTQCVPDNTVNWDANEPKLAFSIGADVRLDMNPRVSIVPSFRIHFVEHNGPLHGLDHRNPQSGDRWFLAFGASISVR